MVEQHDTISALKKFFGFNQFKGQQEAIIQSVLNRNDTFVIMPTGGGKSMCYQLPALMQPGTALVVSPLIALMKNQVDSIRSFATDDSVAHVLNSSLTKTETNKVFSDVRSGRTKLLFVAPESLGKESYVDIFKEITISFVAIDEAHCISEWGHDFRPEYRKIKETVGAISDCPIIALTATATEKVAQDIQKSLGMKDALVFKDSFNRDNLFYEVRPKKDALKQIVKHIKQNEGESGIIYCLSRKKVEELAQTLQLNGIKALPYHAGLDANLRAKTQDQFLMEDVDVIVATIAFGMGIDKPDVRYVIHYSIPKSIESYYQETGRAGRDGGQGVCISFYSYKDLEKLEKFLNNKNGSEREVGRQLLEEITSFSETSLCRRKFLLHYFGETYNEEACGKMCDNCKNPREKVDCTTEVKLLMNAIASVKEQSKAPYIISLLMGKTNNDIKQYRGSENPFYGKGEHKDDRFWNAAIRQCVLAGLLKKDVESFGVIKFTEAGYSFLEKPTRIEIVKEHDYSNTDDNDEPSGAGKGAVSDMVLFKMLKELRKSISKKNNVPPFVIFQDPSLEDMSTQYPINNDELRKIFGVSEGKIRKYGDAFSKLIAQYVEENNIERPDDFVMRNPANKGGLRIHIIQSVDRKVPLDEIAKGKKLAFEDVLNEMEKIVASGSKLNISYYLEDELDSDDIEEIFEYFMESETDDVATAVEEFDGSYTEEEIRLVKIKFMSDIAN